MRNDISFPCMEQPPRCYITTAVDSSDAVRNADIRPQRMALSCNKNGNPLIPPQNSNNRNLQIHLVYANNPRELTFREEWILIPEEDEATGICKIVNRQLNLALAAVIQNNPENQTHSNNNNNSLLAENNKEQVQLVVAPLLSVKQQEEQINGNATLLTEDYIHEDCFLWNIEPAQTTHGNNNADPELQHQGSGTMSSSAFINGSVQLRSVMTNWYLGHQGSTASNNRKNHEIVLIPGVPSSTDNDNNHGSNLPSPTVTASSTIIQWNLEHCAGELCYIQMGPNPSPSLLMCDHLGNLQVTSVFGGWEVWRFTEAGNDTVRISCWTHKEYFLECNAQGRVRTTTVGRFSNDTLWRIDRVDLEGVSIQSVPHERYLTLHTHGTATTSLAKRSPSNNKNVFPKPSFDNPFRPPKQEANCVSAVSVFPGRLGTFRLTAAHRLQYHISSIPHDKRLSLLQHSKTPKTTHHRRDCEVWQIQPLGDNDDLYGGYVMIVSQKWNKFLYCTPGQRLGVLSEDEQGCGATTTSAIGGDSELELHAESPTTSRASSSFDSMESEVDASAVKMTNPSSANERRSCIWRIIPSPVGRGVCIISAMEHGLALSCSSAQGELRLVHQLSLSECWNLEPKMSHSLERWQINLMIGGAVGAALLGPAIMGTAAGLMAGTTAAAEGAAAAGGVAAATAEAGVVAAAAAETAAGVGVATTAGITFGLAEASAAAAAGAALGVSATGIVVASSKRSRKEGTSFINTSHNRPFCDWRRW